ncbi:histone chaperone napB [Aspergillus brunneoviolaceus CBS 621.78]|uniref:Uncharacterized protein n=1 Tax=Aspergillus brunneoviolaceus CBS 621.78 TaxID=1450534 RepID=A0ACD1FTN1_9EURO|nr:hypothetical protein BO95DRAFT_447992 [Aspergillus brunneoviolaceus CBS 621.78]RAH40363.1 hypothetical protein BO95DRAFT_447992 [Aspergillus brunneoviolaceus CBS 621.78]
MSAEEQNQSLLERIQRPEVSKETQKKIALVEQEFIQAEVEQLRHSTLLLRPLFAKRNEVISSPDLRDTFWTRVMLNAPAEVEEHITMTDATILASTLKNLTVERFEVDDKGVGEPRSFRLTFEFRTGDENPYFTNDKLVKDFYWRKQVITTANGHKRHWDGLVSDPVRINWKEGQDPTKGLLDAACDLAEAEKKKDADTDRKELKEFEALMRKRDEVEADEEPQGEDEEDDVPPDADLSFFAFFGYRGSDVTEEQSKAATKEEEEKFEKLRKGEEVGENEEDEDDEDDDLEDDFEFIEIFPGGEELAIAVAEDLWPNAMKYYVTDQSIEEVDYSDIDASEDEDDEEEQSRPRKKTKV